MKLRISLRVFLVLFILLIVSIAFYTNRVYRQASASRAVQTLGGVVYYRTANTSGNMYLDQQSYEDETFSKFTKFVGPDWFYTVYAVDLSKEDGVSKMTNDDLVVLAKLRSLEQLEVTGYGLTDDGVRHFLKLKNLKFLMIASSNISYDGFEELRRGLPNCEIP